MAKVTFSKLNLKTQKDVKEYNYGEHLIEVRQYLSAEEKQRLVEKIVNNVLDDKGYYDTYKLSVYFYVYTILEYTNISCTEKQLSAIDKVYDSFKTTIGDDIYNYIPQEEYQTVLTECKSLLKSVYQYKNSALGILESISADYSNLDFDINKLSSNLNNPENLTLVKEILTKMG